MTQIVSAAASTPAWSRRGGARASRQRTTKLSTAPSRRAVPRQPT
jgi:hypothetical protein